MFPPWTLSMIAFVPCPRHMDGGGKHFGDEDPRNFFCYQNCLVSLFVSLLAWENPLNHSWKCRRGREENLYWGSQEGCWKRKEISGPPGSLFPIWLPIPRGNTQYLLLLLTSVERKITSSLICQATEVFAANQCSYGQLLRNTAITLSPDSDLFCRLKESAINVGSLIRILMGLVFNSYNIFIS